MEVNAHLHVPAALPPGKYPQSRSERGGKEKCPCLCHESDPGRPAHSLFATDWAILCPGVREVDIEVDVREKGYENVE
jgi:hypothetical protein